MFKHLTTIIQPILRTMILGNCNSKACHTWGSSGLYFGRKRSFFINHSSSLGAHIVVTLSSTTIHPGHLWEGVGVSSALINVSSLGQNTGVPTLVTWLPCRRSQSLICKVRVGVNSACSSEQGAMW